MSIISRISVLSWVVVDFFFRWIGISCLFYFVTSISGFLEQNKEYALSGSIGLILSWVGIVLNFAT